MDPDHHKLGKSIKVEKLRNRRAINFAVAVQKHNYAELRGAVRARGQQGIEFDVQPEIPQRPVTDIRKSERMCVTFPGDPNQGPGVFALRKDFPSDLQHLNLTEANKPKSLCLFEEDYRELKTTLTAELLLNRIFSWLTRAANDEQHLVDQPLEPFLLSSETVIFSSDIFDNDLSDRVLIVIPLADKPRRVYRVEAIPADGDRKKLPQPPCFMAVPVATQPWYSRTINQTPTSVEDLNSLLSTVGVDLVQVLQQKTVEIFDNKHHDIFLGYEWLLLVRLRKTREIGGDVETTEDWAFFILDTVGNLGQKLGVLAKHDGTWARCLGQNEPVNLNSSLVLTTRPTKALNRKLANRLAGVDTESTLSIAAVGAGAIGSHVMSNLARQGIGKWTIIDEDQVLPHNHSRYALSSRLEGRSKAKVLAEEIQILLNDQEAASGIDKDVMEIEKKVAKKIFGQADHILDFSVSPAVSRFLASFNAKAPRSCIFLLKEGFVLVIICEGLGRRVRLDDLEIQLAIASTEKSKLKGLFKASGNRPIRYSGSCRDITTVLAQDVVATQSGLASCFLKENMMSDHPSMTVWHLSRDDLTIRRVDIKPCFVSVYGVGDWKVRISQHALGLMKRYRSQALPNETGGVLLGSFDILSRVIYVGTVLPSPPDSKEWPMTYIRGIKGLKKRINNVRKNTGGHVMYVGEWHSHPKGFTAKPSRDDLLAHHWLAIQMSQEGYPGVMIIQAAKDDPAILIGQI
jgi:hypothetical protein